MIEMLIVDDHVWAVIDEVNAALAKACDGLAKGKLQFIDKGADKESGGWMYHLDIIPHEGDK